MQLKGFTWLDVVSNIPCSVDSPRAWDRAWRAKTLSAAKAWARGWTVWTAFPLPSLGLPLHRQRREPRRVEPGQTSKVVKLCHSERINLTTLVDDFHKLASQKKLQGHCAKGKFYRNYWILQQMLFNNQKIILNCLTFSSSGIFVTFFLSSITSKFGFFQFVFCFLKLNFLWRKKVYPVNTLPRTTSAKTGS